MGTLGAILSWIVFGLVIGLISRALYPGTQKMGIASTIALGIAGSVVGGLIAWALGFGEPARGAFDGSGWIMSIVGGLIVVWAALAMSGRRHFPT
jgi:uncharacterized membrane protein YeaQ/YmgE (transglycosylase-associated protein family)